MHTFITYEQIRRFAAEIRRQGLEVAVTEIVGGAHDGRWVITVGDQNDCRHLLIQDLDDWRTSPFLDVLNSSSATGNILSNLSNVSETLVGLREIGRRLGLGS